MRFSSFFIFCTFIFYFAISHATEVVHSRYEIISEVTENGNIKQRVYEIKPELISDQSRISQRLIFEKISSQPETDLVQQAILFDKIRSKKDGSQFEKLSRPGATPLWTPVKEFWTEEDELNYSNWFAENAGENFNLNNGFFADCADTGLLFRWAYAHDNKLPIANTLSASGKLFGHFSSSAAWDQLPTNPDWRKDEKFKAALKYLFNNTYTHTVYSDLYPTEITTKFVRPGSMYMIIRKESGHTQTIYFIQNDRSTIYTLWGTEPASDQIYVSDLIWEPAVKNIFGAWRWPQKIGTEWKLTAAENMPGYSTEQFAKRLELNDEEMFEIWVNSRMGFGNFDLEVLKQKINAVYYQLSYRLPISARGAVVCGTVQCDPEGDDHDSFTTNIRDQRIREFQAALFKTIDSYGGLQAQVVQQAIKEADVSDVLIQGFNLTYQDYIFSSELVSRLKSDANLSFLERWGLSAFPDDVTRLRVLNQQLSSTLSYRVNIFNSVIRSCPIVSTCSYTDLDTTN